VKITLPLYVLQLLERTKRVPYSCYTVVAKREG